MARLKNDPELAYGFVSTLESPDYGYFGGYLIVSPLGRPLEFHCTCPVQPSRAQEILYGPTLHAYLLGEQICVALFRAGKIVPQLVLTDETAMLVARNHAKSPMALLLRRTTGNEAVADDSCGSGIAVPFASTSETSRITRFDATIEVGGYELVLPTGFESERLAVSEFATQLAQKMDLFEPFGRIHEAIREAQRIGGRSESHGQAA